MEGEGFPSFQLMGKTFSVGLCGDFWDQANCRAVQKLGPDIILWPVYTDFNYNEWNTRIKFEYADQALQCGHKVAYVNSYCLDGQGEEIARGGAALFEAGRVRHEVPSGAEAILVVEV